jgi:hypothetical protein
MGIMHLHACRKIALPPGVAPLPHRQRQVLVVDRDAVLVGLDRLGWQVNDRRLEGHIRLVRRLLELLANLGLDALEVHPHARVLLLALGEAAGLGGRLAHGGLDEREAVAALQSGRGSADRARA